MPSTNKTPNIGLNKWIPSDHITTGDFIDDNRKIDDLAGALTHVPYVGSNGNWYIWNVKTGKYEDSGYTAKGPQGETGPQGPAGNAASITVGTVEIGDTPSVKNVGTPEQAVFDFVFPKGESGGIPNYAGRLTIHVNTSDGGAVGNTRVVVRNEKLGAYFVQPLDALGDTTFELLANYTYHINLIDYPSTYYGGEAVVTVDSKDDVTETITLEAEVVGFEINQSTGEVIYTDGAVNFAPASMNFDTDTFDYGSWMPIFSIGF